MRIKKDPWIVPYDVEKYGGTEADIKAFIISANVYRRHDPKRRRAIIAELLKENPTKSDRAIAKEAKPIITPSPRYGGRRRDVGIFPTPISAPTPRGASSPRRSRASWYRRSRRSLSL